MPSPRSQPALPSPPRLEALDLARGFAVWFMVSVHLLQEWSNQETQSTLLGKVILFLGSPPAAPVFMFLMGASLAFSRRSENRSLALRGLQLFALGMGLNAVRGTIPAWIGIRLGAVSLADMAPYTPWNLLWDWDILPFAGPALVLIAGLRGLLPGKRWAWLGLAGLSASIGPLLWGIESGFAPLDYVLRAFWGTGVHVSFPMFPWLAWPLAGMAWGAWLHESQDLPRFFRRSALVGAGMLAVATPLCVLDYDFQINDYWRAGPGGIAWMMGFVLVWISVCKVMVTWIPPNPLFHLLLYWSRHVTRFYIVQWLVIAWGTGLVGYEALGMVGCVGSLVLVPVLATLVTILWARWRSQ